MTFEIHNLKISIQAIEEKINKPTGFFKSKAILRFLELKLWEKRGALARLECEENKQTYQGG